MLIDTCTCPTGTYPAECIFQGRRHSRQTDELPSNGSGWLAVASAVSTSMVLFASFVVYQWRSSGDSFADPLLKPLSGFALRFQMGTVLVLFSTGSILVTFAICARLILDMSLCATTQETDLWQHPPVVNRPSLQLNLIFGPIY